MRHTHKHFIAAYVALLNVFALAVLAPGIQDGSTLRLLQSQQVLGVPSPLLAAVSPGALRTQEDRVAFRLQYRLYRSGQVVPPLSALSKAVAERQQFFKRAVTAHIYDEKGKEKTTKILSAQSNPLLLSPDFGIMRASYKINPSVVQEFLLQTDLDGVQPPVDAVLTRMEAADGILRAETTGIAKSGMQLPIASGTTLIVNALLSGTAEVDLRLVPVNGKIRNETGEDLGELSLLASGRSNYKGSEYGRARNVQKALSVHVNNTIVPPGTTFSFNSTLGGPVTESKGWSMAKVIYNGDELRPAPGGGICQASTTVYRAIVNAGFPVVERRAHSLYVSYYAEYGVGIDATIYPGTQDLVFLNDTNYPLLIQAYNDGYDAYVNIYGTPDGRHVDLEGPYFSTNAPEDFRIGDRKIGQTEIAWVQRVHFTDGTVQKNVILSRYQSLPDYVKRTYAIAGTQT